MQLPVVQIQTEPNKDNPSGIVEINQSDYEANPSAYKLVGAKEPELTEEEKARIEADRVEAERLAEEEKKRLEVEGKGDENVANEKSGKKAKK